MRLSIDLSNRVGSLALHRIEGGVPSLVGVQSLDGENRHSELLLTLLENFLRIQNVKTQELSELVTSLGPGSFTGLRIAVSTMKAFSMAWKLPLFLVNASEVRGRAFQKRNPAIKSDIVVLTKVASKSYSQAILTSAGVFIEDVTIELERVTFDNLQTLLADSEDTKSTMKVGATVFPIQAEFLGEQLDHCKSLMDCRTFDELVRASPVYYGSSRF